MDKLIEARGVSYKYGDGTSALNGVDFALHAGETVAFLGANGSGKTTFVMALAGLIMVEGSLSVCGLALTKANLPDIRRRIGLVFQDSDEQLFMPTVWEDVAFGPRNLGLSVEDARSTAMAALAEVHMEWAREKAPYHLSAGEKKKVAIAGVLAMKPELLVLDEPTTYLDPPSQRELIALLKRLKQPKILVTHDVPLAKAVAGRAVFFEKGRIVEDGRLEDIVLKRGW